MKVNKSALVFALVIVIIPLLIFGGCTRPNHGSKPPEIENGILNLKGVALGEDSVIRLSGNWLFYWDQLLTGDESTDVTHRSDKFQIPGNWGKNKEFYGRDISQIGHATFKLTIYSDTLKIGERLTLLLPKVLQSFAIYQKHSIQEKAELLGIRGLVGTSQGSFLSDTRPLMVDIELGAKTDIYIQVSNYLDQNYSGIVGTPILGKQSAVLEFDRKGRRQDYFIVGAIFTIGLIMLILFVFSRSEKAPFWLALFSFVIGIRILVLQRYILEIYPELIYTTIHYKALYLTMTLAVPTYLQFLIHLFPDSFKKPLNTVFIWISWTYSTIIVLSSSALYTPFVNAFMVMILITIGYATYCYLDALKRQNDTQMLLAFLGSLSIVVTGVLDIVSRLFFHSDFNTIPYGLLLNIFFMASIVALSNSIARKNLELSTEKLTEEINSRKKAEAELNLVNINLERRIEERTDDLEQAYLKLVDNAHKAGKAEIAANTLHNVGNVLNSVTTSISYIRSAPRDHPYLNISEPMSFCVTILIISRILSVKILKALCYLNTILSLKKHFQIPLMKLMLMLNGWHKKQM